MLFERNGMTYSSKHAKHIRVKYYFIKFWIESSDKVVKQCPTGEMLVDHFTKPLQGALFRKFRKEIQRIPTSMNDGDTGWDAPGTFNAHPEAEVIAMDKHRTHEYVGNDQHNDHLLTPGSYTGHRERRGVESCLVDSIIGTGQIRHMPQISYCEAANRGLTKTDVKP